MQQVNPLAFNPGNLLGGVLQGAISGAIGQVIPGALQDAHATPPAVPLPQPPQATAEELERRILERLAQDPRFQRVQETAAQAQDVIAAAAPIPWYRSQVIIGSVTAMASPIAGLIVGRALTPDDQALVTAAVTCVVAVIGGLVSLVGRIRSKAQPVTTGR